MHKKKREEIIKDVSHQKKHPKKKQQERKSEARLRLQEHRTHKFSEVESRLRKGVPGGAPPHLREEIGGILVGEYSRAGVADVLLMRGRGGKGHVQSDSESGREEFVASTNRELERSLAAVARVQNLCGGEEKRFYAEGGNARHMR